MHFLVRMGKGKDTSNRYTTENETLARNTKEKGKKTQGMTNYRVCCGNQITVSVYSSEAGPRVTNHTKGRILNTITPQKTENGKRIKRKMGKRKQ